MCGDVDKSFALGWSLGRVLYIMGLGCISWRYRDHSIPFSLRLCARAKKIAGFVTLDLLKKQRPVEVFPTQALVAWSACHASPIVELHYFS